MEPSITPQPRLLDASLDTLRRIERFSVAALPARASWQLPGWICLADDGGYIGRANSATPQPDADPVGVSEVAESYVSRGLRPAIRWTPEAPESTASEVSEAGWQAGGEVLVMTSALERGLTAARISDANDDVRSTSGEGRGAPAQPAAGDLALHQEAPESWRTTYASSYGPEEGEARLRLALAAPDQKRYAQLRLGDQTVGVGLGLVSDGIVGLFDVLTQVEHRRQGVARRVVGALLEWGTDNGAELAFLQVATSNVAAIELYEKLGFTTAYTYVYVAPTPAER